MPEDFDRCVETVTKQRMKDGLPKKEASSSAYAICTATFKKAGKKYRDSDGNLFFESFVPIKEFSVDGETQDFMIEGIAINETVTSNGHKFIADELRKSAPSLMNVPLLKDHNNEVGSIVGRVRVSEFDEVNKNIIFKARINNTKNGKEIQELVKEGDLNTVSVGASVNPADIEELEDGTIIPHNIQFKELSVVAVPADSQATFSVALMEAYNYWKHEKTSPDKIVEDMSKVAKAEEKIITEEGKSHSTEESVKDLEEDNIGNKLKGGYNEMAEEQKVQETKTEVKTENDTRVEVANAEITKLSEKLLNSESKLKEFEAKQKEQEALIAEFKAKERKALEKSYAEVCSKKKVKALDVSAFNDSTINVLIKQMDEVEEPKEEVPETTQAPVEEPATEPEETTEENEEVSEGFKVKQGAGSIKGSAFTVIRNDYRKLLVDRSKVREF